MILRGEGQATVLKQEALDECGLVYIGNWRQIEIGKWEQAGREIGEEDVRWYRKYGVAEHSHVGLRIADLRLVGPGPEGTGNGIHIEYANSYGGPCLIEEVHIAGFGSWQGYFHHCYGGAFIIRDSKIGGGWVGDGLYFETCHGGQAENLQVHDIKLGGIGVKVTGSYAFTLASVLSENNRNWMHKEFWLDGVSGGVFAPDPQNLGVTQEWFAPSFDDHDWAQVRSDQGCGWERQGFPGYTGFGWYRQDLEVPADMGGIWIPVYLIASDEPLSLDVLQALTEGPQ